MSWREAALLESLSPLSVTRASCLTQPPFVLAVPPNYLESKACAPPDRASATLCRLSSDVYRTVLSVIVNFYFDKGEVSTIPGQLHPLRVQFTFPLLIFIIISSLVVKCNNNSIEHFRIYSVIFGVVLQEQIFFHRRPNPRFDPR